MSYKEKDILHENDTAFVLREKSITAFDDDGNPVKLKGIFYSLYIKGNCVSTSTEVYTDLSVAIARADYLDKRKNEK